jgi:NAD(P)H-hydrate epimerase
MSDLVDVNMAAFDPGAVQKSAVPSEAVRSTATSGLPVLTVEQASQINRLMVEEYGLGYSQMLEQAGRTLASLARRLVGGDLRGKQLVVLVGAGNKGGAGLVATRYLHNAGAKVLAIMSRSSSEISHTSIHQYRVLTKIGVSVATQATVPPLRLVALLRESDLTIDALLGSGLAGYPRGSEAFLMQAAIQAQAKLLALDVPSGLVADTGTPYGAALQVKATLALGLPKVGVTLAAATSYVGELYLADIGIPPVAYTHLGMQIGPLFSASDIILLRRRV